jgi:hypothetical protein
MANAEKLTIPAAIYDYVLYYECAQKDWLDFRKRSQVKGDGSLMNAIKWDVTFSIHPNDTGGATKFGIIATTWESFVKGNPGKGYNKDLNSMNRQGWIDVVGWFWNSYSYASSAANYACACLLFQMSWGGFSKASKLADALKSSADKTDYKFISSSNSYRRIADATHAYTDPMKAFSIMRNSILSYYFNISTPTYINSIGKKNDVYRVGWFNRVAIPFTLYGLYVDVTLNGGKGLGLKYESTIADWDAAISQHMQNGAKGIIKLLDWGVDPASMEQMMADAGSSYGYFASGSDASSGSYIYNSSGSGGGSYGGCGGVYNLGDYSNAPDAQIVYQQTQNRDEVLSTLVGGSYTPDQVKKCPELITSDKKKNEKAKSEKK